MRLPSRLPILLVALLAGCVSVDPETNQVIPRGQQRYEFDEVTKQADRLELGMTKFDVLNLLGSPAEKDDRGDKWVYLPERSAILVPGRALVLEFRSQRLAEFGYHSIILGKRM
jgi:outer membrane protein assembly factor BamE (lipoprotein component of BamABCDE complex)